MTFLFKKIILIGFKHVGKTVLGQALASRLSLPFRDLDHEIEAIYQQTQGLTMSCRQIVAEKGESYFRDLEKKILQQLPLTQPEVLSLGGGAPLDKDNQEQIKNHLIIHVQAPKTVVFERIISQGHPSFIKNKGRLIEELNDLWQIRHEIYTKLARFSIVNTGTISSVIDQMIEGLYSKQFIL